MTGLEFEQGAQIMLEADAIRTKDGEDGSGVGRRHRSRHKKRQPDRDRSHRVDPSEQEIDDHSGEHACEHDTKSSQCNTRGKDGFDIR